MDCGRDSRTACLLGPQLNSALAQEALKIGVPTALTGTYAGLGNEARRAITFATEEANAKGGVDGRKVELKVLDTEAKPESPASRPRSSPPKATRS